MTVDEKVKLLDMLKAGRSYASVARHYGLNESTVRYIKKDEVKIRKTASITFSKDTKRVVTPRNKRIVQMENALSVWISDCQEKKVSLDTNMIRTKAKALYDSLVPEGESNEDDESGDDDEADEPQPSTSASSDPTPREKRGFVASKGWFEKFKRRFGLRSVPLYGEAASADQEAALRYVEDQFPKLIEEGGYLPEQVFNMDETGLFWKRMPSRTFLYKDEVKRPEFKAHKDRVTLLMCGNAAGFMLKPGLIYKSLNPRALKNKNKALLPVYWMSNKKAWITKALTLDWFVNCFIPQVKLYLAEKGLPFKVLLLMDCAGGHATDLHYDGVQVEFLPPNTTSLIQPMDQGVIRAFKALYTRSTMEGLISSIDEGDEDFSLKRYWRGYNIATCLANIQKALNEMKEQTLNASWRKLWPDVVHDYKGFTPDEVHHSAVHKAVRLARLVATEGFSDMTTEDVNTLIECHSEPLTDEDLVEMTRSASEEEEEAADDDEAEERGLTLDNLQELCNMTRALQQRAQEIDDNMVRAVEFSNRIDGVMALFKGIFAQKKKQRQQLPITMFLVRRKPPAEAKSSSSSSPPSYCTGVSSSFIKIIVSQAERSYCQR
ncbi:tigger transposable element-derived protein 1-like [Pholidichthys leucotaenia]